MLDTARIAYCILSDQYTDNSSCFFYGSESRLDQEETEISDFLIKNSMYDFEILVYHENVVTISCFRTFLIFIQSYILNFCIFYAFSYL